MQSDNSYTNILYMDISNAKNSVNRHSAVKPLVPGIPHTKMLHPAHTDITDTYIIHTGTRRRRTDIPPKIPDNVAPHTESRRPRFCTQTPTRHLLKTDCSWILWTLTFSGSKSRRRSCCILTILTLSSYTQTYNTLTS